MKYRSKKRYISRFIESSPDDACGQGPRCHVIAPTSSALPVDIAKRIYNGPVTFLLVNLVVDTQNISCPMSHPQRTINKNFVVSKRLQKKGLQIILRVNHLQPITRNFSRIGRGVQKYLFLSLSLIYFCTIRIAHMAIMHWQCAAESIENATQN